MLPLTWCACYFPKIIILRFEVISEKIRKNPVNTEKTFSMYYSDNSHNCFRIDNSKGYITLVCA